MGLAIASVYSDGVNSVRRSYNHSRTVTKAPFWSVVTTIFAPNVLKKPNVVEDSGATADGSMRIQVNGREHDVDEPLTVLGLIERLGWDTRKIAVERNLEIVPRSAHDSVKLQDGDRIEIVNFVGGG